MADICRGSSIRSTSLACLIAEDSTLETHQDCSPDGPAGKLFKSESTANYEREHVREYLDIGCNDPESYEKVSQSHERYDV